MYTEVTNQKNGDKARMEKSYTKTGANGKCLQFWYMMYGRHLGSLNVYMKVNNNLQPIWNVTGDQKQGRTWLKGIVTLKSNVDFKVGNHSEWLSSTSNSAGNKQTTACATTTNDSTCRARSFK